MVEIRTATSGGTGRCCDGATVSGSAVPGSSTTSAPPMVAPSAAEYDLRRRDDAEAMIGLHSPTWSSTWPPRSAGSAPTWNGRRTCNPDNLLMGTHLLDATLRARDPKTVVIGTICSYPKFTPVPFSGTRCGRLPREGPTLRTGSPTGPAGAAPGQPGPVRPASRRST